MPEPGVDLVRRLKHYLTEKARTIVRSGASPEALDTLEAKHRVVLPADFRRYFLAFDGMGASQSTNPWMSRFWPLAEIMPVREYIALEMPGYGHEPPRWADDHYAFFDFLLHSYAHVIRLSADPDRPTPVSTWHFGGEIHPVAGSFTRFLERYFKEPCLPGDIGP